MFCVCRGIVVATFIAFLNRGFQYIGLLLISIPDTIVPDTDRDAYSV